MKKEYQRRIIRNFIRTFGKVSLFTLFDQIQRGENELSICEEYQIDSLQFASIRAVLQHNENLFTP